MNIFVTGTGTGIGKTVVSAIITEALQADYWKPVQAGFENGTDSEWVQSVISASCTVHPEKYRLKMPASPHIAAEKENILISIDALKQAMPQADNLVIEGAGGLMVPLNNKEFVADLIKALEARVVIVSRNTLGSINHSLLTALACRQYGLRVLGWIFNDNYLNYENEIAAWTGFNHLGSIPFASHPGKEFISEQAATLKKNMYSWPW